MNTQSQTHRTLIWLLIANAICSLNGFAATAGDNFNSASKDPAKWGNDIVTGRGVMTQRNGRLEYTCVNPSVSEDLVDRPWVLTRFPADADWEIQIDTFNNTSPGADFQVNSMGFTILDSRTASHEIFAEFYASRLGGGMARTGFLTELQTGEITVGSADRAGGSGVTNGAIRVMFTSADKVVTVYYDTDVSNDYQWVFQASFGLAGSGGENGNTDWGLTPATQFALFIYGYSSGMIISSGSMFVDNFVAMGGVPPSGGASPDPIGRFRLGFPTSNPLLTAIANLTGNFTGFTPTLVPNDHARTYNMDVAQDESGKLAVMGTVDGIANAQGGSEIGGSVGSITTVNSVPAVQLQTSFTGLADGIPATAKTTSTGRGEFIDVGGGSNSVPVTLDISAKVAGVPIRLKNTPTMFPADSSFEANLKRDWNLDLDISRKLIKGKQQTVASAQLLLPNGDTIAYPEKVVRYSKTKGYSLTFKRGTNVTVNPSRIDKKSSVLLKGLKFVQQGADWQPSGGTISYQFLGQKGTANVLDFVAP